MCNNIAKYYLGIDPSLRKTGLAIIILTNKNNIEKKAYCIKSNPKKTIIERIAQIRNEMYLIINKKCNTLSCSGSCIEAASHNSIGRHDDLGQVRGGISLWLYDTYQYPLLIPPKSLKKFATKSGEASKHTMIKAAQGYNWNIPINESDQADAALLAELAYALDNEKTIHLNRKQLEVIKLLKEKK